MSALQGNISPSGPKVVAQLEIPQLAKVLIDILKRQPQPVLLLLEDLQWAGRGVADHFADCGKSCGVASDADHCHLSQRRSTDPAGKAS